MSLLLRAARPRSRPWQTLAILIALGCGPFALTGSAADFEVQAAAGEPFGVAKITLHLPQGVKDFSPADGDFQIAEKDGRVFYPTFLEPQRLGRAVDASVTDDEPRVFYFLFRGAEPLDVTFRAGKSYRTTIAPSSTKDGHAHLAQQWLDAFVQRRSLWSPNDSEVSPLVDNYLAAMLARRMNLQYEPRSSGWFGYDPVNQTLALLLGTESIRAAMARDTILKPHSAIDAVDQPLPTAVTPPALEIPAAAGDVAIEPMARHVPHECFYVRFGSFENFQWFRSKVDNWGGDLRNLTAIRGIDYQTSARLERQLLLKETALSQIFGPQVIADVAIVGHDTFVREGSSLGFIFQAKNNMLLSTSLGQQRSDALKRSGVTETRVRIADHDVSLISSPDNRTRSFYAVDGDFHLITNSRTLVRRFFEAGCGADALADSHEFRYARTLMPLSRNDAAFAYLSDEFFRSLVGPKYRMEMTRRMQAQTDLELIQLARLAAKAEKEPGESIEELVAAKLLPTNFGVRSDGSRPVPVGDHYVDSMRGARGFCLPVADVPIEHVTKSEADAYATFADLYRAQWKRMDPVMVAVQHRPGKQADREQIVLDFHIAPFARQHYGLFANFLGPATRAAIAPVPGDIVAVQAVLRIGSVGANPFHGFAGLRDHSPEFEIRARQVVPRRDQNSCERIDAYYGMFPINRVEKWLFNSEDFDKDGYAEEHGERARRIGDFGIRSPRRDVLEAVGPQLRKIETDRPAQVRLHVGDLSQAKLADIVNAATYLRADQMSHGNSRFLHNLAVELQVPPENCLAVAEDLFDGKLVCPLDGKYELREAEKGLPKWTSTRWITIHDGEKLEMPAGYVPPPLTWFRGLDLEFGMDASSLDVHAEVDVERR
jgi:hypothetical protein